MSNRWRVPAQSPTCSGVYAIREKMKIKLKIVTFKKYIKVFLIEINNRPIIYEAVQFKICHNRLIIFYPV